MSMDRSWSICSPADNWKLAEAAFRQVLSGTATIERRVSLTVSL